MIDNIIINGLYEDLEKEDWEDGRVENVEFAVKDLPLGRTPWLIDWKCLIDEMYENFLLPYVINSVKLSFNVTE